MNITLTVTAILTILPVTNEVKIGTATIGNNQFDVVKLQVVTNRIIQHTYTKDIVPLLGESWTNTIEGPIVGTNLVQAHSSVNLVWTNSMLLWSNSLTNVIYYR